MENVNLPTGLQSLTFDRLFHWSIDVVNLSAGLQSFSVARV